MLCWFAASMSVGPSRGSLEKPVYLTLGDGTLDAACR
jgi:hypothetical protein